MLILSLSLQKQALAGEKQTELRQGLQLAESYKQEASVEQLRGTQLCAQAGREQNIHTGSTYL